MCGSTFGARLETNLLNIWRGGSGRSRLDIGAVVVIGWLALEPVTIPRAMLWGLELWYMYFILPWYLNQRRLEVVSPRSSKFRISLVGKLG